MSWEPILLAAALWWGIGMTAANVLYRRGHESAHWLVACGLAGPLGFLLVADQARFVEPQATSIHLTSARSADGVRVLIPLGALGWIHPGTQPSFEHIGQVTIAATVPFELAGTRPEGLDLTGVSEVAAESFPGTAIDVVSLPGRLPDALASWATHHTPTVILTAREAHPPATIARLARLVAGCPGVALVITDHRAIPAEIA